MATTGLQPPDGTLAGWSQRPAVPLAVLFAAGVALHDVLPPGRVWPTVAATLAAAAGVWWIGRRGVASLLLAVALLLCGVGLARREHHAFAADDIGRFATDDPRLAEVRVRLADDDPQLVAATTGFGRPLPPKQTFAGSVVAVRTADGAWTPATGSLPVQVDQPNPSLAAGQTVDLLGMLQRPRPADNPGQFDWAAYYRQQRVTATLTVTRSGNARVVSDGGPGPLTWLRLRARRLLAAGFAPARAADHALLAALCLGVRDASFRTLDEPFRDTGVGYELSVTGLHVALLAAALFWGCRRLLFRPATTLVVVTTFTLLYAAVAVPAHSGVRAAIFALMVAVATAARRTTDRVQLLAVAVVAVLAWHPLDLDGSGFRLSGVVVVAILAVVPRLVAWAESFRNPHTAAAAGLVKPTGPQRLLAAVRRYLLATAAVGVVAWLAAVPLVAYEFGSLTPWTAAIGVVLFPVVVVALFAGVAKVLLTLAWPGASPVWAAVATGPAAVLRRAGDVLAALPGGTLPVPAPPAWLVVAYYALLFAPLLPVTGRRRWAVRLAPVAGLTLLLASTVRPPATAGGPLRVTLLSVGAGQCCLVRTPGGHAVMVDCGSDTVDDVGHQVVAPYLRAAGLRHLDALLLSHGDYDHISAAGDLAAGYGVAAVYTSRHFRRNAVGNAADLALLDRLDDLRCPVRELAVGDHVDLGDGVRADVLWPPPDGLWNSNNAGLVLRLTYAGRSVLLPADVQDPAFAGLLARPAVLRSDVLVAAHHGSSETLTGPFLDAVAPRVVVSSNASRLTNKQKRFDALAAARGLPVYRTSEYGAVTVTVAADGTVGRETFRPARR